MWCFKLRYYEDGSYYNAEGIVAGLDMIDAVKRLKEYYGENAIEKIHMAAMESGEGVLDFNEFPNIKYTSFFSEENN